MMNSTFIISGEVHGGKTTYATHLAKRLTDEGFQVSGFVCPGTFHKQERTSFDIEFLNNGEKLPFAKNELADKWINFRRFSFNPEAIHKGNTIMKEVENSKQTVMLVDEIGKWELEEGGWYMGMKALMQKQETIKVIVIRKNFLSQMIEKFDLRNAIIFDIQNVSVQEAYERIISFKLAH